MTRTLGAREASLRAMREQSAAKKKATGAIEFCTYPRCKCIASTSTGQPDVECPLGRPPGPPAEQKAQAKPAPQSKKESKLSKAKPVRTAAKAGTKPAPKKSAKAGVVDRTPLAIGNFIVAGGTDGVTMAQLVEKFDMEAHPMRSKIFTARHTLKFNIKHDDKNGRYIGKAPAQKKTAPPKIAKAV